MLSSKPIRVAAAGLVAALVWPAPGAPAAGATATDGRRPAPGRGAAVSEQFMQVVAHEDDDLFFMNPDIDRTIAAGAPSVTVYVTAGQITGDGDSDEERARNRQRGIQNAYATMAGLADADDTTQNEWTGAAVPVLGKTVERYALRDRAAVQLVFMNLHDGRLGQVDAGATDDTVVPDGGVAGSSHYTRADVVSVLRALMTRYGTTVLRAQDPAPDNRYSPDHADHVAAARLAADAAAGYTAPLFEVNYRDYNIGDAPVNLEPSVAARKSSIVDQYYRYDHDFQNGHAGDVWLSRLYYRRSRGTNWAGSNADSRAQAFAVHNGAVFTYWQRPAGGWAGPLRLADPGGRVAPGLAVGRNADGRLEVFAIRLSDHHLLSLPQAAPNGGFRSSWADLGNPNEGLGIANQVGAPAVAANGDGRLEVFVKNGGGGVSTRYQSQPNGGWSAGWVDLSGADVQDGLSAVTNPQGRIELFASTRSGILHWFQRVPNGVFTLNQSFPGGPAASPPHAVLDEDGRIEVAYRQPGTGRMSLAYQIEVGGAWAAGPVDLGGDGGVGEPGMVLAPPTADGRIMIFQRNRGTGVSTTRQVGPTAGFGGWTDLGGVVLDHPAAALGGGSRAVVFTIGTDGVYARRQVAAGGNRPFGGWEALGF